MGGGWVVVGRVSKKDKWDEGDNGREGREGGEGREGREGARAVMGSEERVRNARSGLRVGRTASTGEGGGSMTGKQYAP